MSQIWKIFKRKVEETVEVIELTKCLNFSKEERKNEMIELMVQKLQKKTTNW